MFDLSKPRRVPIAYKDFGYQDRGLREYYFNLFSSSPVDGTYYVETWKAKQSPKQEISKLTFEQTEAYAVDTFCREPLSLIVARLVKQLTSAQSQN
jgi:hypothetical protein